MTNEGSDGRVVVGVDGSDASRVALRWAADHAVLHAAGLDIVHAWSAPYLPYGGAGPLEREPAATAARTLAAAEEDWIVGQGAAPADLRSIVEEENPGIAMVARSAGARLVVVGSRGRGRLAGVILGSVSQRCVDHAACPVAVLPPGWRSRKGGPVVVGIDGSEASALALEWAYREAACRGVHLDVVHAFDVVTVVAPFGPAAVVGRADLEKAAYELLEDAVAVVAADADARPRSVELVASASAAAPALLAAADGADLLVVGSRGRSTFRTVVAGSVAQHCARRATCPVVVVRPGQGT
jgi:nucleotide-binding universal stress UspA family protein